MATAVGDPRFQPGMVTVVQTAGDLLAWHPHVHALASRGGWDRHGPVSLRARMRSLTPPNAGGSVGSGHGSSAGSTRSTLCSATSAVARCGSSLSSSSRAPSARSWLTWQPEEAGRAARRPRLSHLRAPWPHEARRQRSASRMAELCAAHAFPGGVGPDQEEARRAPGPDRTSSPRSRPDATQVGLASARDRGLLVTGERLNRRQAPKQTPIPH
jgi:hypothetical protein